MIVQRPGAGITSNGSVAKIEFGTKLVIRNGLVEPFNNLNFVDFGVFATEPEILWMNQRYMPLAAESSCALGDFAHVVTPVTASGFSMILFRIP